ncbi:MAG: tetratricopeptide repeat protein [Archangium sp.]|nr:tetratricopeptide repeat protein [Archangium sp.]MDP3572187.1 tetratricopeptide repeat protein [Archangium sp.]
MRPLFVLLVAFSGCAPVLRFTRPTPPEASLGNVRTLSVSVKTDMGKAVENAVITGLVMGEIPVPIAVDGVVKDRLSARLEQLGYVVCPSAPCGEGEMTVLLTESAVGTELTQNGLRSRSRLRARIKVKQLDGQEPYDFTFWDRRSGRVEEAPLLVRNSAESIAGNFAATLLPGRQNAELPLEDGGPLSPGVNMLLSSNWDGAIGYFTQLTQQQPELDGAWYDLGVAWEARGDWGQALGAYEQAAARDRKRNYLDAVDSARRMAPPVAAAPVPVPIPVP